MSRNKNRTSVQTQTNTNQTPPQQAAPIPHSFERQDNPFGLSFVVPTEIVKLPSGGYLYDENSPLRGLKEVEVKAVTAAEEDIMINDSFIQQGVVFNRLIDSIVITPGVSSEHLMDCDKIAILMSARKTGYGDNIDFNVSCASCAHQYEMEVSLSALIEQSNENIYSPKSGEDWEYLSDSNTYSFNLPSTGLDISIKLLTPSDSENLLSARKQKEKLGLPHNETIDFLRAVIVSAHGVTDRSSLNRLVEVLPAIDARAIRSIHNKNIPSLETSQETTCPSCGHEEVKEVPFSLGWFWSY